MRNPLRTLIVEDSEIDAELLTRTLQRGGYEPACQRVDTAQAMQAALEQSAWDIVISDYSMPSFSGVAALRVLQQHGTDIPFIMLSGVAGEDIAVAAMKAGAHDFVTKGNLERLVPAIEREMREAAMRREHKHVEHALRASQDRFAMFMEHSPVATWIADEASRIVYANTGFARLLGSTPDIVVGKHLSELFSPEHIAIYQANNQHILDTGQALESIETAPRRSGDTGQYLTCKFPLQGPGRQRLIGGVALDITERMRAEEAQARLAAIVESSSEAIISRDMDGVILSWNASAERMFGWTAHEAIGKHIRIISPPEKRGLLQPLIGRVKRGEIIEPFDSLRVRKDGTRFLAQMSFSAVKDAKGSVISLATIVRDITERKQAEAALREYAEQMRSLTQRLSEVEETERRNINRELHDRIGPSLVALKLNFHLAQSRLPPELRGTIGAQIEDAQKVLETTVVQLRNVMADLRPPALDDYGLLAALRTYAQPYAARLGIPVSVRGEDIKPRPPLALETALFRIAQEALNNIAKHAQAKHVEIAVSATAGHINLFVEDDGTGFDAAHTDLQRSGWGLRTMRERAQAIGADLRIESAPGKGTRIVAEVAREAA